VLEHLDDSPISIHAPNEGSDSRAPLSVLGEFLFQSTLPMKGATSKGISHLFYRIISIHAPNEGSDIIQAYVKRVIVYISIHAPNEGSDSFGISENKPLFIFQSTLPMKGATYQGMKL